MSERERANEAADLVEKLTFELQTRPDRVALLGSDESDLSDGGSAEDNLRDLLKLVMRLTETMSEIATSVGWDVAVMHRMARLIQQQEEELTALRQAVDGGRPPS
jgi:hypothetical protein